VTPTLSGRDCDCNERTNTIGDRDRCAAGRARDLETGKVKPAVAKAAIPAAEETVTTKPAKGAPGFTAVFVIAGLLAVAYAMMRRRS